MKYMSVKSNASSLPYWMRSRARNPCRFICPRPIACPSSLARSTDGTQAIEVCSDTAVSARIAVRTVAPRSASIALAMFSEPRLQDTSRPTYS